MNGTTLTFNLDYSCTFIVEEGEGGVGQRDWGAGGVQGRGERGEGSSLKVEKWEEITQQWLIFCN